MPSKSIFRPLISGAMLGLMLAFPRHSALAAAQALAAFAQNVLPALFPFTAFMLLFTAGRSHNLLSLLFLALLGGSPSGARLFASADIDSLTARRIARCCGTMSPMFFLSTLAVWLQNSRAACLVLICHFMSAILLAIPLFFLHRRRRITLPPLSVSQVMQQSASGMLTVAACITLGAVGAAMAGCLFPHLPALPLALLQSLSEVTLGCKSLIAAQPPLLLPLICFFTAFSGFSILLQNAAFFSNHSISLKNLIVYGLFRGTISFLLCFLIFFCHPGSFAV